MCDFLNKKKKGVSGLANSFLVKDQNEKYGSLRRETSGGRKLFGLTLNSNNPSQKANLLGSVYTVLNMIKIPICGVRLFILINKNNAYCFIFQEQQQFILF